MRTFSGVTSPMILTPKSRSREGLTINQMLRKSKLQSYLTHLVLKEQAQRLYNFLKGNVLGKAAHIVVRLNNSPFPRPDSTTSA